MQVLRRHKYQRKKMTKEQIINNFVTTLCETTNVKADRGYICELVKVALDGTTGVRYSAVCELQTICGYKSEMIAQNKIAMLRAMIANNA